jgi:hypothetical protein
MPCPEEHLKKLDAMIDAAITAEPSKKDNGDALESLRKKDADREDLRQGALSKEQ